MNNNNPMVSRAMRVLALAAVSCIAACSSDSPDPDAQKPLVTIDPATAGTITGTISFDGVPPEPKKVDMEVDPMCNPSAETQGPMYTNEVVVTGGRLANVFVYLSDGVKGRYAPPAEAALLDQRGCRYHPHVLGVMVGQTLTIRNGDSTLHNVHAAPQKNKPFNFAQTQFAQTTSWQFDRAEVMIPVSCDVHGWMRSYIAVLSHPFFAVTGEDGAFEIKGVPPGTYRITAWHEKYGTQEATVNVGSGGAPVNFTYKAP